MFVLGLQGSPRKKGNTAYLLSTVMSGAEKRGAETEQVFVPDLNIEPCLGCGFCEKKGYCVNMDDDMARTIFPAIRRADIVILASPVYFYNVTAQLKRLIDRTQALWSRKYRLKQDDPGRLSRKGIMLAVGATKGKNLFDGMELTAKYFFDAIGGAYAGALGYRRIESFGDMEAHPGHLLDVNNLLNGLGPLFSRKKVMFACRENACRSQMAAAFARFYAGKKIDAFSGGSEPAESINPLMIEVMAEKGIDMAYLNPAFLDAVVAGTQPDILVTMGCGEACPFMPGVEMIDWDLPDPAGQPIDFMRNVRDRIEKRVCNLIEIIG